MINLGGGMKKKSWVNEALKVKENHQGYVNATLLIQELGILPAVAQETMKELEQAILKNAEEKAKTNPKLKKVHIHIIAKFS